MYTCTVDCTTYIIQVTYQRYFKSPLIIVNGKKKKIFKLLIDHFVLKFYEQLLFLFLDTKVSLNFMILP